MKKISKTLFIIAIAISALAGFANIVFNITYGFNYKPNFKTLEGFKIDEHAALFQLIIELMRRFSSILWQIVVVFTCYVYLFPEYNEVEEPKFDFEKKKDEKN